MEEAFVETSPNLGLPTGLKVKAGRALWNVGYLNEHHAHTDDFTNRPLPYRVFLNKAFNDDGAQISYVLPTSFYSEIGGGSFAGNDFPFGEGDGSGSYLAYLRFGGDIGANQNWRAGFSNLSGQAKGGRSSNEDLVSFVGKTKLYIADFRYNFAPDGNVKNKSLTLQGEYFLRDEDGTYEDSNFGSGVVDFAGKSSGFYLQSTYKFKPNWRLGLRYSQLNAPKTPNALIGSVLDSAGFNPKELSLMLDWSNSEFSTIRLQLTQEEFERNERGNQIILQYVMSFGAHSSHNY
ncbi:MAG: hypothetical protein ACJAW3_000415 [Lentimonas sp.]